jgi:PTS system mannose-specific IIA component
MIGILLVTHGDLGKSLLACAQHIMSRPLPHLAEIAVSKADPPEATAARVRGLIEQLDKGAGVLLLTDIFGGTPSNVVSQMIEAGHIEAVAGVNLPMLVRALTYAHEPLPVVVTKAITGGLAGVMYMLPGGGGENG